MLLLPKRLVPRYQHLLWSTPQLGMIGILVAWQVFDFFFNPAFSFALNALYFAFGASYS